VLSDVEAAAGDASVGRFGEIVGLGAFTDRVVGKRGWTLHCVSASSISAGIMEMAASVSET